MPYWIVLLGLVFVTSSFANSGVHNIYHLHHMPEAGQWKTHAQYRYKSVREKQNIPNSDPNLDGNIKKYNINTTLLETQITYGAKYDFEMGLHQDIALTQTRQLDSDSQGSIEDDKIKSGLYDPTFLAKYRYLTKDWGQGIFDLVFIYSPSFFSAETDSSTTNVQVTNVARGGSFFSLGFEAGKKNDDFGLTLKFAYGLLSRQKIRDLGTGTDDFYDTRKLIELAILTQTRVNELWFLNFNIEYENTSRASVRIAGIDYFEQSQPQFDIGLGVKRILFDGTTSANFLFSYHYEPTHDLSIDGNTAISITGRQGFDLVAGLNFTI